MPKFFSFIYRCRRMAYIGVFFLLLRGHADEKAIVVVIPSYNNTEWYQRNLDSVLQQNYGNFRVIYIDDASTDGTGAEVGQYLAEKDLDKRVTLIQNCERQGALANIYRAVWMCDPTDIIVAVDGDDWLFDSSVLNKLNQVYADKRVWMTYGQFLEYPTGRLGGAKPLSPAVIESGSFRSAPWVTTHLRTFYAALFHKIHKEDLLFEGDFYRVAWDLAFMFPMLEMAHFHVEFISQLMYVYNTATPLSDLKLHFNQQAYLSQVIRGKKPYKSITYLLKGVF